jgi:hypothetical protein
MSSYPTMAADKPLPDEFDCYTIEEFCRRHGIGKQFYYYLRREGIGPQTLKLGGKVLITKEAAARWRAEREAATAAAAGA